MMKPTDEQPPDGSYDLGAEACLLACSILNAELIPRISQHVGDDPFALTEHKLIWRAVRDVFEEHGDLGNNNLYTLKRYMDRNGTLDELPDRDDYLMQVVGSVPDASTWEIYAADVLDAWRHRQLIAALAEARMEADRPGVPIAERVEAVRRIFGNGRLDGSNRSLATKASTVQVKPITWLVDNMFPLGSMSLLVGEPGLGKTFVSLSLAAAVTRGRPWPTSAHAAVPSGSVVMLSDEDETAEAILPRFLANDGDPDRLSVRDALDETWNLAGDDLMRLDYLIRSIGDVKLLIVDPITSFLGSTEANSNAQVRSALIPLQRMAKRHGVALIAVSHFNKKLDLGAINRVLGSVGFVAAARSSWALVKDREHGGKIFMPVKCNYSIEPTGLSFDIEAPEGRVRFEDDPMDRDVDEVLGGTGGRTARTTDEILAWVRDELLADGKAVPAREVPKLAEAKGFVWRTVKAATSGHPDITKWKSGVDGQWYWSLRV